MKRSAAPLALLIVAGCATTANYQSYISPSEVRESATLVISREDAFLYSGLSADISMNGNKVGSLAKGGSDSFYAPPGRNFISITAFGTPGESNLSFNTKKGETYSLLTSRGTWGHMGHLPLSKQEVPRENYSDLISPTDRLCG